MNIKRLVLIALIVYVVTALGVLFVGFFFGDPDPAIDPAQSLLQLNESAQNSIASRTNDAIEHVAETSSNAKKPKKVAAPKETAGDTTASNSNTASSSGSSSTASGSGGSESSSGSPSKPNPSPSPTPSPSCGQGGTCTVAQVAAHNSQGNCWVRLGSKAYNVTSYVHSHPGGAGAFDGTTCGTDITAQMQGAATSGSLSKKKNHPQSAYNTLNSYFVANVAG